MTSMLAAGLNALDEDAAPPQTPELPDLSLTACRGGWGVGVLSSDTVCHQCTRHADVSKDHRHPVDPSCDAFRFSDAWLGTEAGKIMLEEHRFRFGKSAWRNEYRFIHEREAFRADDMYEVSAMEGEERMVVAALVFGRLGLRPLVVKCAPDEIDPHTMRADMLEVDRLVNGTSPTASSSSEGTGLDPDDKLTVAPDKLRYRVRTATRIPQSTPSKPCENNSMTCSAVSTWYCADCNTHLCGWCNAIWHGCLRKGSHAGTFSKAGADACASGQRVTFHDPLVVGPTSCRFTPRRDDNDSATPTATSVTPVSTINESRADVADVPPTAVCAPVPRPRTPVSKVKQGDANMATATPPTESNASATTTLVAHPPLEPRKPALPSPAAAAFTARPQKLGRSSVGSLMRRHEQAAQGAHLSPTLSRSPHGSTPDARGRPPVPAKPTYVTLLERVQAQRGHRSDETKPEPRPKPPHLSPRTPRQRPDGRGHDKAPPNGMEGSSSASKVAEDAIAEDTPAGASAQGERQATNAGLDPLAIEAISAHLVRSKPFKPPPRVANKPLLRRKPTFLKGRKVFAGSTPAPTALGTLGVGVTPGDPAQDSVPFRRRANSERCKLERLGSDAAGSGPAAAAARFRLKAMHQRLQTRRETDEAREFLAVSYENFIILEGETEGPSYAEAEC
eukprot:m.205586 g.205586  ORF g.205586 m.205586 type:complete len:676 (+) comp23010_c0_seq1:224-2251(+)